MNAELVAVFFFWVAFIAVLHMIDLRAEAKYWKAEAETWSAIANDWKQQCAWRLARKKYCPQKHGAQKNA